MPKPPPTSPYAPDLAQVRAWLERMVAALRFVELVTAIVALVGRMGDINAELTKQLVHLRRRRPKSESLERLERQLVLPLVEVTTKPKAKAADASDRNANNKNRSRKGRHPGRGAPPAHLERVLEKNLLPPEKRICPICGSEMKTLGYSKTEIFNVIPAKVIVTERWDERAACPHDDAIVSALAPPAIVERGLLGDTLIVEALCDKYIDHLPIERQCVRFARMGVDIAPQTLGRSVAKAIDLLMPVAKIIQEKTRGPGLLGTDSTGLPVLDPELSSGIRTGGMWCRVGGDVAIPAPRSPGRAEFPHPVLHLTGSLATA